MNMGKQQPAPSCNGVCGFPHFMVATLVRQSLYPKHFAKKLMFCKEKNKNE
jgi:hypothetical protein